MAQDNKNLNQRKIVPNNLNGTGEDPKKRLKFNIYWIYGILFASIIGYNLYGVTTTGLETDIESFKEMAKQGDVKEIKIIRNKKIVRVFIILDSLRTKLFLYNSILNLKN